jgi:hypothetical protein
MCGAAKARALARDAAASWPLGLRGVGIGIELVPLDNRCDTDTDPDTDTDTDDRALLV